LRLAGNDAWPTSTSSTPSSPPARLTTSSSDGLEQRVRIGTIGLVAPHVGPDISRGQQAHRMSVLLRDATPVVRRPTGLHHHVGRRFVREEPRELPPIQALTPDDVPLRIRDGELEHGLCDVYGHWACPGLVDSWQSWPRGPNP
jgi:hypothetical protein